MERISKFLQRLPILAILLFLAGIGMLSLLFATTPGVGVTPDSVVYFDLARNLSDGHGFVATNCEGNETPTTRFPPLFPALLALFGKAGIAPVLAARWLNLLLFGANILLVGLVLRRYTNNSLYPAALGSFFMLSSPAMIETHSTAWTEPLFFFFGMAGLLSISVYLETGRKGLLIYGSSAIALACLARYVGGTLIAAAVAGIFVLGRQGYRRKFAAAILCGIVSILPIALWSLRNFFLSGNAVGRIPRFHPVSFDNVRALVMIASSWLVPGSDRIVFLPAQDVLTSVILFFAIAGLLAAGSRLLVLTLRQSNGSPFPVRLAKTPVLFLVFFLLYPVLLFVATAYFDATAPFEIDNRILSPAYIAGLIVVLYLMHALFQVSVRGSALRVALYSIGSAMIGVYTVAGAAAFIYLHVYGRGFTAKEWQFDKVAARLHDLASDTLIYSNYPTAVYFRTGRTSCALPRFADTHLPAGMEMIRRLETGQAVVVYFHNARKFTPRNPAAVKQDLPSEADLQSLSSLVSLSLLEQEGHTLLYRTTGLVPNTEP